MYNGMHLVSTLSKNMYLHLIIHTKITQKPQPSKTLSFYAASPPSMVNSIFIVCCWSNILTVTLLLLIFGTDILTT